MKIQEFSIGKQENMKKVEDLMKILDKINKRLGFQALIKNQRKSIAAENFKDFLNKKITEEFDDFIRKIEDFSIRKQENMKKVEDLMKILDKINKTKGFQALIKNQRKSIAAENFKNLFTIKIKETFEGFINKIEDFSMKKQENMKNIEDLEKILEKINKIQGFQALIENKRKSIAAENIKDFINKKIIEEFENFIKKIQEFSEKKQENMKNIEDLEKTLDKINKRQGFQTLIKYQRKSIAVENIKDFLNKKITEEFDDFIRKIEDFSIGKQENMKKIDDFMRILEKFYEKKAFQAIFDHKNRLKAVENLKFFINNKLLADFLHLRSFIRKPSINKLDVYNFSQILKKNFLLSTFNEIRAFSPKIPTKSLQLPLEKLFFLMKFLNKGLKAQNLASAFQRLSAYSNKLKASKSMFSTLLIIKESISFEKVLLFSKSKVMKAQEFIERLLPIFCERQFVSFQMISAYSNHIKEGIELLIL